MAELLFFVSFFLIVFAYFGYPLSLAALSAFRPDRRVTFPPRDDYRPTVTMIVTAYNEEKRIREKLENTLSLRYPADRLQILLASDGSTDRTNEIAGEYRERGVELVALPERRGKENAQKEAVRHATGEIVVFTDAATILDTDALVKISSNFIDPTIGCVSSEDRLIGRNKEPSGEGAYVRYEMWLRRLESRANTIVGLSGSFFAARSEVCQDFSGDMQSDFRTLLNSVRMGFRGVSDPASIGYYYNVRDEKKEFDRKVRTILRGITVFFRHSELLNVFRYGLFSYQLFCHKLLRWLIPLLLAVLFLSNFVLAFRSNPYLFLFLCQFAFYLVALIGNMQERVPSSVFVKIPVYFVIVNSSILLAWWRYFKGDRVVMWKPSER